jgi:hypothetical protein
MMSLVRSPRFRQVITNIVKGNTIVTGDGKQHKVALGDDTAILPGGTVYLTGNSREDLLRKYLTLTLMMTQDATSTEKFVSGMPKAQQEVMWQQMPTVHASVPRDKRVGTVERYFTNDEVQGSGTFSADRDIKQKGVSPVQDFLSSFY